MKSGVHPTYNQPITVACACGNSFQTGSTLPEIQIEICSKCHPFYTGKQKMVDSAKLVDKFMQRVQKSETLSKTRKGKKAKTTKRAEAKSEKEQAQQ